MIAQFVGGSMNGKTGHVFDEIPRTWDVPVVSESPLLSEAPYEWCRVATVDTYVLDGWYVRSTGERIPIYLFKGSS